MKVYPIQEPLEGERVVGVDPVLENYLSRDWRRRLNSYSGRSLSHMALTSDQVWRTGHIASLGTLVSPGVIDGLEVSLYGDDRNRETGAIHISAGKAIDHRGEVVSLTHQLKVAMDNIFTYRHDLQVLDSSDTQTGFNLAERMETLGELINDNVVLPRVLILVLEPVFADINVEYDAADPCEQDADLYAFENWQQMDAFRLVFYPWPEYWIPQPVPDEQWRNVLASNIFQKERELESNEYHPWEGLGIPLSLFGFDENWNLEFIDRNAVVRQGGKRRRTSSIIPDVGNRFMWQAQFQQFNEHMAEIVEANRDEEIEDIIKAAEADFRYFPPVGIIPKQFAELRQGEQSFFPVQYLVEALAIPYEQLDLVVRDSAPLMPIDASVADRVQLLVPVPQQYYEPDLLRIAEIDVEFDETIRRFTEERNSWLGHRLDVRRKVHWLSKSLKEKEDPEPDPEYLKPDPNALDNLEMPAPYVQSIIEIGDVWRVFKGDAPHPDYWPYIQFDDTGDEWQSMAMGIGYGASEYESELEDMHGKYVSILCRKEFELEADQLEGKFELEITTNGGFAVALNGIQIKRYNFNLGDHTSPSAQQHEQTYTKVIELNDALLAEADAEFLTGTNILAIWVQNSDLYADDFVFMPRLINKVFVAQISDDSEQNEIEYGTSLLESDGVPQLDENMEPSFEVESISELKDFLGSAFYADFETDRLDDLGLVQYIENLKQRVNNTNDLINLGFARVQTEMYRVRQYILGNEAATKLATLPSLAGIAKLDSAAATRQEIKDFADAIKKDEEVLNADYYGVQFGLAGVGGVDAAKDATVDVLSSKDTSRLVETKSFASIPIRPAPIGTPIFTPIFTPIGTPSKPIGPAPIGTPFFPYQVQASPDLYVLEESREQVEEQDAIVGGIEEIRTTTVGERLETPPALSIKVSAIATKAEIIRRFLPDPNIVNDNEEIVYMDNVYVPGFRDGNNEKRDVTIANVRANNNLLLNEVLRGDHDKNLVVKIVDDGEGNMVREVSESIGEGGYFTASIRALENASTLLRRVERRTQAHKRALDRARLTLKTINSHIASANKRMSVINTELAEARHDVSVARAMRAEEQARIDAINTRRDNIVAEYVPFLVFRRPRLTDIRTELPAMTLNPALPDETLPACDIDDTETPQEISAMVDTLREAPVKWFKIADKVLYKLDRVDYLHVTVQNAVQRVQMQNIIHPVLRTNFGMMDKISQGIGKSLSVVHQRITQLRQQTAKIDLQRFQRYGWQQAARQAKEVISFGDIIDGNHGRADAAQLATQELKEFSRLGTCLYMRFGEVLPSIRLDWAERLSQFDEVSGLRDLFSLPRWEEIDYIERTEMQLLVDVLYQKIDDSIEDAESLISELVRVALLVASHAPVTKLIAGEVKEPATVNVGSNIDIDADLTRVHVGMKVMVQSGLKTIARAIVDDIVAGKVKARVVHTEKKTIRIEQNTRVQIGEARNFGEAQLGSSKFLR